MRLPPRKKGDARSKRDRAMDARIELLCKHAFRRAARHKTKMMEGTLLRGLARVDVDAPRKNMGYLQVAKQSLALLVLRIARLHEKYAAVQVLPNVPPMVNHIARQLGLKDGWRGNGENGTAFITKRFFTRLSEQCCGGDLIISQHQSGVAIFRAKGAP